MYKVIYKSPDAYVKWDFLEEDGGEWATVDEAVKAVLGSWAAGYEFKVIQVIDWRAEGIEN